VEFENDQVRVLRVKLGAHESAPLHEHADRVAVYLTDQNFRVEEADGSVSTRTRKAGDVVWSEKARHKEENLSGQPFEAVVVELK
jgi:hypothetical protein